MAAVVLTLITAACAAHGDELVTITVALDDEGRYAVDGLMQQCNQALGTEYPVEAHRGEKRLLTPAERLVLLLASEAGVVETVVETVVEDHRITLRLEHPDSPEARRRARQQIRRWFQLSDNRWTPEQGLHVPDGLDPRRPALLLIHGLEAGPPDFRRFEQACRATGIQLLTFDYPNDGPLAEAGDRLRAELKALGSRTSGLRLAVVGHSMGGLVARYALETPGKNPGCVTDLFMLGTPHSGSRLAGEYGWAELVVQVAPAGLQGLRSSMTDGLGEAADDVSPGSPFLALLNARPKPAGVRYHVGVGTHSFLSAEQRTAIVAELQRILAAREVEPAMQRKWIDLLSGEELADGRGDGAVTVVSARRKGADSERTFALNHAELLSLPGMAPESSEVFQWIGSQMGWKPAAGEHDD